MADRTPDDFGSRLRETRERSGITLRQIANATKISVAALEALERNDVSRLPGGIFSRAFVRSYAVEIGLDPEKTIKEFIAQFPRDESVTAGHAAVDQVEDRQAHESEQRVASTVLKLVLVSLPLAGVVLYWAASGSRRDEPPAAAPAASDVRPDTRGAFPAPPPGASGPVVDPTAMPATEPAPPPAAPAIDPADELTVAVDAVRACWVQALNDGQPGIQRMLSAGEREVMNVRRELVLTVGDASAITLTLNGQPARGLGSEGNVVTIRLSPDNYKEYLASQ
jgi:cytoskeleton protein RodZ